MNTTKQQERLALYNLKEAILDVLWNSRSV